MSIKANFPITRANLILDFAKTKTLDPQITFIRGSTGYYYDGVTTTRAEENLLTYSQHLGSSWSAVRLTVTTSTVAAPNGSVTGNTITEDTATGHHYLQQQPTLLTATPYVYSVYAKAGTRSVVQLSIANTALGAGAFSNFDLAAGTTGTSSNATVAMTTASNGWWRCSIRFTTTGAGIGDMKISTVTTSTAVLFESYTGVVTNNLYAWGAQLEQRTTATFYSVTTASQIRNFVPTLQLANNNQPRFDHNPITGESIGLRIEETRTNILRYSSDFTDANWEVVLGSVQSNVAIAPDGTQTADKFVEDTTPTAIHRVTQQFGNYSTSTYTFSAFVKSSERAVSLWFRNADNSANYSTVVYSISSGTAVVAAAVAVGVGYSNASSTISDVGNGWYRISLTTTIDASVTAIKVWLRPYLGSSGTYTGDSFSGFLMWGAQLEYGAFSSGYVPTVTTATIRQADFAAIQGTAFNNFYDIDSGTFVTKFSILGNSANTFPGIFYVDDGTTANTFGAYFNDAGDDYIKFESYVNSVAQHGADLIAQAAVLNTAYTIAAAYATNDVAGSGNGGTVATDTINTRPVVNRLVIGQLRGSVYYLNGHIRRLVYYPDRLSNLQLQALTRS